jgi:hypothetical protein
LRITWAVSGDGRLFAETRIHEVSSPEGEIFPQDIDYEWSKISICGAAKSFWKLPQTNLPLSRSQAEVAIAPVRAIPGICQAGGSAKDADISMPDADLQSVAISCL